MCIYYHYLYKVFIRNKYPFPKINDLFDQLQREIYLFQISVGGRGITNLELEVLTFLKRFSN